MIRFLGRTHYTATISTNSSSCINSLTCHTDSVRLFSSTQTFCLLTVFFPTPVIIVLICAKWLWTAPVSILKTPPKTWATISNCLKNKQLSQRTIPSKPPKSKKSKSQKVHFSCLAVLSHQCLLILFYCVALAAGNEYLEINRALGSEVKHAAGHN